MGQPLAAHDRHTLATAPPRLAQSLRTMHHTLHNNKGHRTWRKTNRRPLSQGQGGDCHRAAAASASSPGRGGSSVAQASGGGGGALLSAWLVNIKLSSSSICIALPGGPGLRDDGEYVGGACPASAGLASGRLCTMTPSVLLPLFSPPPTACNPALCLAPIS